MSTAIATKIVRKLAAHGHTAYFAGGWVRDYLMGLPSDDVDIATDASTDEIQAIFPHTIPVGINFGIVVVVEENQHFEVATFRRDVDYVDGRHPTHVEPATPKEDAQRRSLTINGMFYDPLKDKIYDFVSGKEDLHKKIIRSIGNPYERFKEDRLRMIRAVRFATRWQGFTIEEKTLQAIKANADKLFPSVSMERVWQEFNKMVRDGHFDQAIVKMHRLSLLEQIFPQLHNIDEESLKDKIAPYAHYPKETPTIIYIIALFPEASLDELINLSYDIKASNADRHLIKIMVQARILVNQIDVEWYRWANFYALQHAQLCLEVIAAELPSSQRQNFLEKHFQQQKKLEKYIERIKKGKPLVNAATLKSLGITPGKKMGQLLQEAQRIAINDFLDNADQVLERLQQSPLWP
ncbi:MAG: CCA tRNA nucleotidyltransferase [Chlamydiota bacterium]